MNIKRYALSLAAILSGVACLFAQAPSTASWKSSVEDLGDGLYEILFHGSIADGWHVYSIQESLTGPSIEFEPLSGATFEGELYEKGEPKTENGQKVFYGSTTLARKVRLDGESATVKGELRWQGCTQEACAAPEYWEFNITLPPGAEPAKEAVAPVVAKDEGASSAKTPSSIWALIIEAILWGFAMLLTPCVFPMVPMTVSFFMKKSSSPAQGRFKAFMYGLFIVLLYTVPISVIIMATKIIGGESVTADIFNWLSTHWLPNIIFFIVFMVFAASFFGAFEITLPSSLVNKSDKNSDREGLGGIFFMALTLVLVSFSCTGPIVGSVLIKSTQGQFWTPMITMLAFSVAFALPFTLLAMFPSVLKKLRSGSWLNSVKVVLGFIEVALGLKFLSVADQTYHWGILDREVYLAIWIAVFSLLALYLLGKIHFPGDDPSPRPMGIVRLTLTIAVISFVVYLIPGMWGAPLKALSGYLPPLETQDFVVWSHADQAALPSSPQTLSSPQAQNTQSDLAKRFGLKLPLGLSGYFSLEEGLKAAKEAGKPLFVDITGHGCVNCREMESRVWSDPRVLEILRNDYVITALYTDDKSKLEPSEWLTTPSGKVLKDFGRVNSYIVREKFGVNAQPNYVLLSPDGTQLAPVRGYNLDVEGFVDFLKGGIEAYKKGK